jgi:gliding motility-associated-like protein
LNASGGDLYLWQPTLSLNSTTVASPIASPSVTTTYVVHITDTVCHNDSILSTTVTLLPLPTIKASKSNDIDCSNDESKLQATGGIRYLWTPAGTLDNPNITSPLARPSTATQYKVKGIDAAGCVNYDSVIVNISTANKGHYLMANAFTPNNDGRNDCYGVTHWGKILELDFSVYNRWGEKIFHTKNPSGCWNGRYNGIEQDPGLFVYMIKAKTICESYIFKRGTFVLIR